MRRARQRLLLLTPPLLQTNAPYPATMHLTGFLASRGVDVHQRDLSIKVVRDVLLAPGGAPGPVPPFVRPSYRGIMYDFPTETKAERRAAERYVRGLARQGLVQSCFWHRFALTVHSPIAREPERFGLAVVPPPGGKPVFARNELAYTRLPAGR